MRILVDEAIWGADHLFDDLGKVRRFTGRALTAAHVGDAQALIVRSVTRVGPDLLADSPVHFVGSAVSGEDHLDLPWLSRRGIHVATAAGCNSRTVAEYVLAGLLLLAQRHGWALPDKTVGIVGVGRIGGLLAGWCAALGVPTLLCDPPRAERQRGEFLSLEEVLQRADIVTLHVPLTRQGPHATQDMIAADAISACKHGLFLINTSRGEVVDESALIAARKSGRIAGAITDVWRNEPQIDRELLDLCEIATPHMAGYSAAARQRGAEMIHAALAAHQSPGRKSESRRGDRAAQPSDQSPERMQGGRSGKTINWDRLRSAVLPLCDLESFDRDLHGGAAFDEVRRRATGRLEFPQGPVMSGLAPDECLTFQTLGLQVKG